MGQYGAMKVAHLPRLAWVAFGCIAFLILTTAVFSVETGLGVDPFQLGIVTFPVVGALIASRQPRNALGWVMLGVGAVSAVDGVMLLYTNYALTVRPGSLPRPDVFLALSAPMWVPVIGLMGTFVILLFPDGHLPSPRWRPWAWLCAIALSLSYMSILVAPGSFPDLGYPGIRNPLGIEALLPVKGAVLAVIALVPISIVGCAVALVQRFRRSHGQDRLQLKWLAAASGAVAALYVAAMVPSLALDSAWDFAGPLWLSVIQMFAVFSFFLIPVAVGIAILKHRLYDIDLIINRTVVYGALTAVLALVYVGGVVGIGGIVREATGQQDTGLVVAASTLAVAALVRPVRARIQGFIDRRFYRRKYDAARTVEAFSIRLRDEVDLEVMRTYLLAVVRETMQPARASIWLKR
jgi:hypothetical protein